MVRWVTLLVRVVRRRGRRGDEEDDELDDDIADADAEGFFDEDLAEEDPVDEPDEAFEEPEDDDFGGDDPDDDLGGEFDDLDEGFEDDDFGDDGFDELEESDDESDSEDDVDEPDSEPMASDSNGKSFSELKDEYESGDADWAEGDDDGFESDDTGDDLGGADDAGESDDFGGMDELDDDLGGMDGGDDDLGGMGDSLDGMNDEFGSADEGLEEVSPTETTEPADTATKTDPTQAPQEGSFDFVGNQASGEKEKPYLRQLPGDYVGDLMVMEWLEYLVEEGDTTDAVRAINYYERVEWLSPEVAEQLKSFLSGFGEIDRNLIDRPGTAKLDLQHHTQSLKYIMQLTNATAESVVLDRWPQLSEGHHGNQR
ncbi:MAG: putative archaeal flagellar protein D/E [halophilic archaeon J07HB67]|nr:MAG: putative archaeal flagellar protein D/E [halophilic archaeon J07HB67]